MKTISIDPITRLEGHGKITIFLNDTGQVANAYFQVPELRGFERFCEGRAAEDMPRITQKICGVCPSAHHLASTKTLDALYNVEPPPAAHKIRELFYCGHMLHSHIAHFYVLSGPDFIVGPDAPPAKRNILGVLEEVGLDIVKQVITARSYAQKIQTILGGSARAPAAGIPGGWARPLKEVERDEIKKIADFLVDFGKFTIKAFHDFVLANEVYKELIYGDAYYHRTHYMGLVDKKNCVNFYDGMIRVVDTEGDEIVKFHSKNYLEHVAEIPSEMSYLKFTYLKEIGWKGLKDGQDSGVYRVGPLARLNVADGMTTPLANEEYNVLMETLGHPAHHTLAMHWARVIEIMYAAERAVELIQDPEIMSQDLRAKPGIPTEGVGVVEAPRGTLFHHYKTDERGILKKNGVNLIVGTANNHAAICLSIKKAAKKLINGPEIDQSMLNMVEMAFRAYDPCLACATHFLPGKMPLEVIVQDSQGELVWHCSQHIPLP